MTLIYKKSTFKITASSFSLFKFFSAILKKKAVQIGMELLYGSYINAE